MVDLKVNKPTSWQLIALGAGSSVVLGLAGFGIWNLMFSRSITSQARSADLINEKQLIFLSDNSVSLSKTSDNGGLPEDSRIFIGKELEKYLQDLLARKSEGRNNVGALNRAQQAYYLYENRFASNLATLGIGIPEETKNFKFTIDIVNDRSMVRNIATAKQKGMNSYVGIVSIVRINNQDDIQAILCESLQPTTIIPPRSTNSVPNGEPTCPEGYHNVGGR